MRRPSRKVRFMPSEPLKPMDVTIPLFTSKCPVCGKTGTVVITRDEFRALAQGGQPDEVLPDRDPAMIKQIVDGTHYECQEKV